MTKLPDLFEDSDYSSLPSANPGSGKPWRDATTGALIVGAMGTFGVSQAYVDGGLATKVSKAGDTLTGTLNGTSFVASGAVVGQNILADYYLTTQANLSLRTSGVVKCQNVAGNADAPLTAAAATFSGRLIVSLAGSAGSPSVKLGSFESGFYEGTGKIFGTYNGTNVFSMDSSNFNLRSATALGWVSGTPDSTIADILLSRKSTGLLASRSNSGFAVRNLADSADASFSASSGQFTGGVYVNDGNATPSLSFYFAPDTGMSLESNTVGSRKLRFRTDGADALTLGGSGTGRVGTFVGDVQSNGNFLLTTGGTLQWNSRGQVATLADGVFRLANSNIANGVAFDCTTDGTLKLRNRSNSADANLTALNVFSSASGYFQIGNRSWISSPSDGSLLFNAQAGGYSDITAKAASFTGPLYLAPITFGTLPSASAQTGARYRITDRSQRECYSDGTNWRFAADDAIVT